MTTLQQNIECFIMRVAIVREAEEAVGKAGKNHEQVVGRREKAKRRVEERGVEKEDG